MRLLTIVLAAALGTGAVAQQAPSLIAATPAPTGPVCYYAGLAYSPLAVVTVDVPFRRESPTATQKRLLKCTLMDDGATWGWLPDEME